MDEWNNGDDQEEESGREGGGEAVMETEGRTIEQQEDEKGNTEGGKGDKRRELSIGSDNLTPRKAMSSSERKGWKRRAREISGTHNLEGGKHGGPKRTRDIEDQEVGALKLKHPRIAQEPQVNIGAASPSIMNCLVWNVRGMGSPSAFHQLWRLIAKTTPSLVFLSETRLATKRCEWWRRALGMK